MSAEATMLKHLTELKALERRMEPDAVGRPAVEARIEEAQQALEAVRKPTTDTEFALREES